MASVEAISVMWADAVDPVVERIEAELAELERDLLALRRQADTLDAAVRDAERVAADDERAIELLDRVLARVVRAAGADLAEALERAQSDAAADLNAAQTAADSILADLSTAIRPATTEAAGSGARRPWWALPGEDLSEVERRGEEAAPMPKLDSGPDTIWTSSPGDLLASVLAEKASASSLGEAQASPPRPEGPPSPWTPPPGVDALERTRPAVPADDPAPEPVAHEPAAVAAPVPDMTVPAVEAERAPSESAPSEGAAEKFHRFWHHDESGPRPVRRMQFAIVDAVLPIVVVAIVIVVLLSWLG